jgi:hypothetical protein
VGRGTSLIWYNQIDMADAKITQLANNTTINDADLIVIVDDVAGTPVTEKRTIGELKSHMVSVSKVGTPADNQVGVWTGDGTIEGDAGFTFDGGLGITVADAENKVGLTITQNDVTNDPTGLKVVNAGSGYDATFENTQAGSLGSFAEFYHNSASPANNDIIGGFDCYGNNASAAKVLYGYFNTKILSTVAGAETSQMIFQTINDGDANDAYLRVGSAAGEVIIGDGIYQGILTTNGNRDLILRTGNATTGNITITDGADGLISLTPNGTGAVRVGGTLELGHATDTTISRVSAGVIAVEGATILTQKNLIRYVQCALNGTTALTTSEKAYFRIPAGLTGMNLVSVAASVGTGAAGSSSSGTPTFTVRNVTDNSQMLSTSLTVDANEYTSADATAAAVIDTGEDDVVTDDLIEVAVTTAGTGVTYAQIVLGFQLP